MASHFMARRRRKRLPQDPVRAKIEELSHDGRGVIHIDGKVVFVHGALAGEDVEFKYTAKRRDFDEGVVDRVFEAAADRVEPRCPHASECGGCVLQHLAPQAQIQNKQGTLLENLSRIGNVTPERVIAPLTDDPWGYRRRARLSVRHVPKKGRTLVGFRERGGRFVADLQECHVLHPAFGFRMLDMARMVDAMSARADIPQIEIAVADNARVMVIRHLEPLDSADRAILAQFGRDHSMVVILQSKGPDSLVTLDGSPLPDLFFALPEHDLSMRFTPTNFVQVNAAMNRRMIGLALEKLTLEPEHAVLDLFCGLGNFTLPIARSARSVLGIEGDQQLVNLAASNADANGLANATFQVADLSEPTDLGSFDRVLLDPPRSGAREVLAAVAATGARRVVYVSCHPGSLARDAGILVHDHSFKLVEAGVMDMFPHTAHVESIAVFDRGN